MTNIDSTILIAIGIGIGFFIALVTILNKEESTKKQQKEKTPLEKLKEYRFPTKVMKKFHSQFPNLNGSQLYVVERSLLDFFALSLLYPKLRISMPSRAADELWHAFLDFPQDYKEFCQDIFGKHINHDEEPGSIKGYDRSKPIRQVSKEVKETFNLMKSNSLYEFYLDTRKFPTLFILDAYLPINFGYFYDEQALALISHPTALKATEFEFTPTAKAKPAPQSSSKAQSKKSGKQNNNQSSKNQSSSSSDSTPPSSSSHDTTNLALILLANQVLNSDSTPASTDSTPDSNCTDNNSSSDNSCDSGSDSGSSSSDSGSSDSGSSSSCSSSSSSCSSSSSSCSSSSSSCSSSSCSSSSCSSSS